MLGIFGDGALSVGIFGILGIFGIFGDGVLSFGIVGFFANFWNFWRWCVEFWIFWIFWKMCCFFESGIVKCCCLHWNFYCLKRF